MLLNIDRDNRMLLPTRYVFTHANTKKHTRYKRRVGRERTTPRERDGYNSREIKRQLHIRREAGRKHTKPGHKTLVALLPESVCDGEPREPSDESTVACGNHGEQGSRQDNTVSKKFKTYRQPPVDHLRCKRILLTKKRRGWWYRGNEGRKQK